MNVFQSMIAARERKYLIVSSQFDVSRFNETWNNYLACNFPAHLVVNLETLSNCFIDNEWIRYDTDLP